MERSTSSSLFANLLVGFNQSQLYLVHLTNLCCTVCRIGVGVDILVSTYDGSGCIISKIYFIGIFLLVLIVKIGCFVFGSSFILDIQFGFRFIHQRIVSGHSFFSFDSLVCMHCCFWLDGFEYSLEEYYLDIDIWIAYMIQEYLDSRDLHTPLRKRTNEEISIWILWQSRKHW
jgi:hypothetical protein